MLHAWSIPANNGGKAYFDMPELPSDDLETINRVEWWNAKLTEYASEASLKVVGGGKTEYRLNDKSWLGI